MKDFFSLCSEIYARGAGQKKKDQYDDEKNFDPQFYQQRRYGGSRNSSKRVFLFLMIGIIGIATGCLVLFVNPYDLIFKFKIILSDGGEIYEIWRKPDVELYLRVYLFNVTNRDAFLEGREKIRLEEVGPYVYREALEHTNITFNDNDTITSVPKHPLQWMPELSNGTEEDVFILPNIALLSFANVMIDKSYFSQMAVNLLIRQTDSNPLVEMTAKEFMFGYKSTFVTLGNKIMPSWISFDKLGLIDRMYDFDGDISTIFTGNTDIGKTGLLDTYNRSPKLPQWDLPCGEVRGASDGTKFQSFIKPNQSLLFYRKSLCRPMTLVPTGNETACGGLRAYQYKFVENAFDNGEFNSENKCFCKKNKCLPRGLADITECYYGFPVALSYPHLLNTDPSVQDIVDGMKPDPEKHESYFMVQPESGLPLEVAVRMQINLALGDVTRTSRTGPFKNMILPLLWTEIRMYQLPQYLSTRFFVYLNILPLVQDVSIYLLIVAGAGFVLAALIKLIRKPEEVNPIEPFLSNENPENSPKSPIFNSKDVLSDIIEESRHAIFGKKSVKPKSNVYRETVRQKSSMNLLGFLKREPVLRRQLTKEELHEIRKNKESAKAAAPLKLSSDSETDSSERQAYFAEANVTYSESEESLNLTDAEDKQVQRLNSDIERREDGERVPT